MSNMSACQDVLGLAAKAAAAASLDEVVRLMNEFQFMHAATPSYPIDYMARLPNWQQQEHHQYQEQQRPYVGERRAMSPASRRGAMDRPKTSSPRRMPHAPTGSEDAAYSSLSPLDQLLSQSIDGSPAGPHQTRPQLLRASSGDDASLAGDAPLLAACREREEADARTQALRQQQQQQPNPADLQSSILGLAGAAAAHPYAHSRSPAATSDAAAAAAAGFGLGQAAAGQQAWGQLPDQLDLRLLMAAQLQPHAAAAVAAAAAAAAAGPGQLQAHLLYEQAAAAAAAAAAGGGADAAVYSQLHAAAAGALGGASFGDVPSSAGILGSQGHYVDPAAAVAAAAAAAASAAAAHQLQGYAPHLLFDPALHFAPGAIRTALPQTLQAASVAGGRGGSAAAAALDCDSLGSDSGGSTPVKKTRRGCRGGRQKRWYMAQQMAAAAAISGGAIAGFDVFRAL
ncbi:hypothetical protein MNEG_9205 [Monoraphidium neglectum]|uniref:Uncharacterized protein n=1 Tax=Monoraphidium neglectum TaxID=145388 RepID=A0A0D2JHB3_9CHLO|nr:hypothetical protein MNEG_9205 [Monoraphidium neglectum]KIY98757.1 hypothetical protein MNEG_9205 [Monoraphidium neglectum]|eukprot:XP_013897777.1 hypothetical protein MNEG_9205 [Monoraphidium neglectum]